MLPRHERSRTTILSLKGCLTDSNLISWPLRSGFHDSRGTRCCDLDIVRDFCPLTMPYIKIPSTLKQMVYRCWQTYQVFDGQCWSVTASGKSFHAMLRLEGLVSSVTTGAECLMLVKEMTGTCIDQVREEQPSPCPFHIFPPFLSFPMEKTGQQLRLRPKKSIAQSQALSFIPPDGEFPLASVSWSSRHWIGGTTKGTEMLGNLRNQHPKHLFILYVKGSTTTCNLRCEVKEKAEQAMLDLKRLIPQFTPINIH